MFSYYVHESKLQLLLSITFVIVAPEVGDNEIGDIEIGPRFGVMQWGDTKIGDPIWAKKDPKLGTPKLGTRKLGTHKLVTPKLSVIGEFN
jgi:hypothetical protein